MISPPCGAPALGGILNLPQDSGPGFQHPPESPTNDKQRPRLQEGALLSRQLRRQWQPPLPLTPALFCPCLGDVGVGWAVTPEGLPPPGWGGGVLSKARGAGVAPTPGGSRPAVPPAKSGGGAPPVAYCGSAEPRGGPGGTPPGDLRGPPSWCCPPRGGGVSLPMAQARSSLQEGKEAFSPGGAPCPPRMLYIHPKITHP